MASLRDIRDRINSVKNTQQVTSAMKMVAAAKLRRAQERIFKTRPYAFKLGEMIAHLQRQADPEGHDLFLPRDVRQGVLVIVVTADRGLAGAFNSNVIKLAETTIREKYADVSDDNLYLLCVGRKSHEYFAKRDYQLVGDFRGLFNDLSFSVAQDIVDAAVEGYLDKQWDEVTVVYNEFKNTISQNRIAEPLLPIPKEHFLTPVMEGGDGPRGDGGGRRIGRLYLRTQRGCDSRSACAALPELPGLAVPFGVERGRTGSAHGSDG